MFMLNMVFNFDKERGLFSGDDDTVGTGIPEPLRASRNWLRLIKGVVDPSPLPLGDNLKGFDPELDIWENLGEASTLLIPRFNIPVGGSNPANIAIRLAPDNRGTIPPAATQLQLAVSFGRPIQHFQPQASPFTHNDHPNGHIVTTFVFGPRVRNTSRAWFFHLGTIAIRPAPDPNRMHRYEFALGIIVTDGGKTRHYSEDPEMDIGPD